MATAKTHDDLLAMDNMRYDESLDGFFWIGLKKKYTQYTCRNDDCDNYLTWADGTDFKFNGVLWVAATQNAKCFVYEGNDEAYDNPCTVDMNEFLCQYECPTTTNDDCNYDVKIDGCHTGTPIKGAALDVASCQDYCKSDVPAATHFQLKRINGGSTTKYECRCKAGSCPLMNSIGFVSGKITCGAGKMFVQCLILFLADLDQRVAS